MLLQYCANAFAIGVSNFNSSLFNEFNHDIGIIIERLTFDLIVITAKRKFE
ncbi:hypothetical protein BAZSYMA_ACONTIG00636_7 [Bathymodiolus azoricus thioautotrophic gill symbiont]|uniref:Uncharacterized protein n=1 Tax=Bathymodiolus azoricus thioautotrophic gill symbiont TaxID=235205 RepID=A0A1H6M2Z3_9GAMM|nr:hypothetical protein BAZSYMA_ACONTIG00636_7 [Bathymodiolus azoricus thioautotrophic gill symbiont]